MTKKQRDNFPKSTARVLAERVANLCSNPDCRCATVCAASEKDKRVNIGEAAHICAASPGGPRYDENMTPEQRMNISNGIWLCGTCHTLIDSDEKKYTVEVLNNWKETAEKEAIDKLGKKISNHQEITTTGWTGYLNWSDPSTDETEYIFNDESVIYHDGFDSKNKISLIDGINMIRNNLLTEKCSVRLAGLSGTGKTRLAQALFDYKIGKDSLDKQNVIYGDIGNNLSPEPITYLQYLIEKNQKAILIVDNCEASMHNKLTKICQRQDSHISLMTIEYDVKEDDNVESNNYYLSTTSDSVLRELLESNFKSIDASNIESIVKFSDGNYRIAIYLAKSILKSGNVGVLNNNEILEKLFYQGKSVDEKLLNVGEVCSLFYSFNITYEESVLSNEVNIISELIGIEPRELISKVEELRTRQIVQKRGNMRAVLPHALANKLAINILNRYPAEILVDKINNNKRLLISFFRRIKFLHSCDKALDLAEKYLDNLTDDDLINADDSLIEILKCINILHPGKMLDRIQNINNQTFFSRENYHFYDWIRMLGYCAYEEKYFYRAISLIICFALTEKIGTNNNSIRDVLSNFFHICLSYTHASLKIRLEVIDELLYSEENEKKQLGLTLLDEILQFGSFHGSPMFDNGSQIRDYGLTANPKEWFTETFEYIDNLLLDEVLYEEVKDIVANNICTLYPCGFGELIEEIVRKNIEKRTWPKVWIALLYLIKRDKEKIPKKVLDKMNALIEMTEPNTIEDKIMVYLDGGRRSRLALDIAYEDKDANELIYNLGKEIGNNLDELSQHLKILNNDFDIYKIDILAKGLFDTKNSKDKLITIVLNAIDESNERILKQLLNSLVGFYHNNDGAACDKLLDDILENKRLNKYFLIMQLSYNLDNKAIKRIVKAIDYGLLSNDDIRHIEGKLYLLKSTEIISVLDKISLNGNNGDIIINSLYRLFEQGKDDEKIKKYSRNKIKELDFNEYNKHGNNLLTYMISELIKKIFDKNHGTEDAIVIFKKINGMLENSYVSYYDLKDILEQLITTYPIEFLNTFIDYKDSPSWEKKSFFKGFSLLNGNIINQIPHDVVIKWIKKTGKDIELSYLLEPYKMDKDNMFIWNELADYLFNNYTDIQVVKNIAGNIYPRSWDNDFSDVMKRRENLIKYLKNSDDKNIKEIGKKEYIDYQSRLEWHLEKEKKEREDGFGRFE